MAAGPAQQIIYSGTSNVVIPGNKLSFPEEFRGASRLHYYSTLFNSVEINSSFYKIPLARTLERWAEEVTPGFRFSLKFPKTITHARQLVFSRPDLERFVDVSLSLGSHLGCYLLQFPKSIGYDYLDRVDDLLGTVRDQPGMSKARLAVEFREPGWYAPSTLKMIRRHRATVVQHDIPHSKTTGPLILSRFMYLRFHGQQGNYRGSYPAEFIRQKAAESLAWISAGREVYAYFNNTIGDAFNNAREFLATVQSKSG